jgi:hypothetical protein
MAPFFSYLITLGIIVPLLGELNLALLFHHLLLDFGVNFYHRFFNGVGMSQLLDL